MKYIKRTIICFGILGILLSCASTIPAELKTPQEEFAFIMTSDWRHTAMEQYHSTKYFQGALESIEKVGKGSFMVSPGDIDPVAPSAKLISDVLGEDYPWYPIVGNHEIEDSPDMPFLREINAGGNTLPNIVNTGPSGSVETMYSFDYEAYHFVVLNQYFDGQSDTGTDGDMVPETLQWLENDLKNNTKPYVFIVGHEPLMAIPDMSSGRTRHEDSSLNKYPRNASSFHKMLLDYNVVAYLCGHTHSTSYAMINGVWQFDSGHARGTEDLYPEEIYESITNIHIDNQKYSFPIDSAFVKFYRDNAYPIKKVLYYMDLTNGISYKKLDDSAGYELLKEFYNNAKNIGDKKSDYFQAYWDKWVICRSTFMKFRIIGDQLYVDIYRNNGFGGPYIVEKTVKLIMNRSN